MSVADVGAGEGYYTVRLAPLVGADGSVLAQDIVPQTRDALAQRVTRERLDTVAVNLALHNAPMPPEASFDRELLHNSYTEIERTSDFLCNLPSSLTIAGNDAKLAHNRTTLLNTTP